MTREDRAITIVDLLSRAMAATDSGEKAEQLICSTLAKTAHAETAVLLGVDPGRKLRLHAVWPDQRRAAPLAEIAVHGGRRAEGQLYLGQHPALGEIATIGPDLDPSHANEHARLLALSRRGGFSSEAQALFAESVVPLQLLMPHAAEACQKVQRARTAADAAASLNLTAREVEVLQLLAEGLLARTIAARLGLSPRTVHKHLSNVYAKLGVHDRLVAVGIARTHGLISS